MDTNNLEVYENRVHSLPIEAVEAEKYLEGLNRYIQTGEPQHVNHIYTSIDRTLVDLLDLNEFDGKRVMATHYENENAYYVDFEENPPFEGRWTLEKIFDYLGDKHAFWMDFVNNYKAKVVVEIDDTTAVVFDYEIDEQPGICQNCENDKEYMRNNEDYNCGHGVEDTYEYRFHATIMNKEDLKEVILQWS